MSADKADTCNWFLRKRLNGVATEDNIRSNLFLN